VGALRTLVNWDQAGWTPKLNVWWNKEGRSATWIGKQLGVSRGAVLGKVHRMGWSNTGQQGGGVGGKGGLAQRMKGRRKPVRFRRDRNIVSSLREQQLKTLWRAMRGLEWMTVGNCATKIVEQPGDTPASERKSFLDLERNECRWPFDDGTFCARPRDGVHTAYCCDHHKRSVVPSTHKPVTPSW
jgi:hypothetical protein